MKLSGVFITMLLVFLSVSVSAKSVDNIRIGISPEYTRLVLDLSDPIMDFEISSTKLPESLVLELKNFKLDSSVVDELVLRGSFIESIKSEVPGEGSLRLVIESGRVVRPRIFALKPNSTRGDRLVVDLYAETEMAPVEKEMEPSDLAPAQSSENTPQLAEHQKNLIDSRPEKVREGGESASTQVYFDGTWEQEWALATQDGESQKFEAIVEPRVDMVLSSSWRLTGIARLRLDVVGDLGPGEDRPGNYSTISGPLYNSEHAEFSLRELYVDTRVGDSLWRLGKQQVVWGQADGIKVLDVVNPQSYREFITDDFDDSRIPLWTVNVEIPVAEHSNLQLLWIPDTTYHELAEPGTPYAFTSSRIVPQSSEFLIGVDSDSALKPDDNLSDGDYGARYSTFFRGWDITFNYLYHYQDFPVFYQYEDTASSNPSVVIRPEYERNNLYGGTLSNAFGDFTIRAEMAYSTDTFHLSSDLSRRGIGESEELASVLGVDWDLGSMDSFISAQWFQSHLFDYDNSIERDQTEHNASFLYQRTFDNEVWRFDALAVYSLNHHDSWLQFKLRYLMRSNLEVWLGGDFFQGNEDGLFGQFSEQDRFLMGMELGF